MFNRIEVISFLSSLILAVSGIVGVLNNHNFHAQVGNQGKHVERKCRSVKSICTELGKEHAQYYRMEVASFYYPVEVLTPNIYQRTKKQKRGKTPNDDIAISICVSIALRYFSGRSPLDIALVHAVSHSEIFRSVWVVVDAVNQTKSLNNKFPKDHVEQRKVTLGFQKKVKPILPIVWAVLMECLFGRIVLMTATVPLHNVPTNSYAAKRKKLISTCKEFATQGPVFWI